MTPDERPPGTPADAGKPAQDAETFVPASSSEPLGTKVFRDLRGERRVPLQLKTALVYHQHEDAATRPTFHGTSHDVSMDGLTLIVDRNIFTDEEVTVLIALPATHVGADKKIIEATAQMIYTVYTGQYMAFRVGLSFRQFKRDGESRLREAIAGADRLSG